MADASFLSTLREPSLLREANLVDGQWIEIGDGAAIEVHNPSTGAVLGRVPSLGAKEAGRAIAAAKRAQPAWRALTAKQRAVPLRRLFELMMAHQEDLARIMTAEQGKPLAESRGEIAYAAGFIEWFAEEGKRIYGDTIPEHLPGRRILVRKEPIGVFAAITPWNFPAAMITRKAGAAWTWRTVLVPCEGWFTDPDNKKPMKSWACPCVLVAMHYEDLEDENRHVSLIHMLSG